MYFQPFIGGLPMSLRWVHDQQPAALPDIAWVESTATYPKCLADPEKRTTLVAVFVGNPCDGGPRKKKKKLGYFSIESWLFNRDPFWLVYSYNRHITEESLYTLNNQVFFTAYLTPSNSTLFLVVSVHPWMKPFWSLWIFWKTQTPNLATYKLTAIYGIFSKRLHFPCWDSL